MDELKKLYEPIIGVKEVCEILNISRQTAYELMDTEGFPQIRFGRQRRVIRDEFFKWLYDQQENKVS